MLQHGWKSHKLIIFFVIVRNEINTKIVLKKVILYLKYGLLEINLKCSGRWSEWRNCLDFKTSRKCLFLRSKVYYWWTNILIRLNLVESWNTTQIWEHKESLEGVTNSSVLLNFQVLSKPLSVLCQYNTWLGLSKFIPQCKHISGKLDIHLWLSSQDW